MTSAIVDTFGTGSALRVYYEGDHDDFIDTHDIMYSSEGFLAMSSGLSSRGSTWEADIAGSGEYGKGQAPGFYIEIINEDDSCKDKVGVTFDDVKGMWKVDTTAVQVAEGATGYYCCSYRRLHLETLQQHQPQVVQNLRYLC